VPGSCPQSGQQLQRGRLAGAVRAQDRRHLTSGGGEGKVIERDQVVESPPRPARGRCLVRARVGDRNVPGPAQRLQQSLGSFSDPP
jgi:hypothetical protein